MSYANRNTGPGKAGTIAAVAAVHAAAIYLLVTGMGVEVVREIVTNLPTREYKDPPPPEPMPEPPKPKQPARDSHVDVVEIPMPTLPRERDFVVPIPPPLPPVPGETRLKEPTVVEPPAPFKPVAATPRGNPGLWVTTNDYPTRDIRQGNEGRAQFLLSIDANGKVTGCRITQSSGHEGLDKATCLNVARRAKFEPARNNQGERVAGTFTSTILWVIPK